MSLDQFKTIYWWEWSHRLLARLVGAAFLLPFLFFLWRGWIEPRPEGAAVDAVRRGRAAGRGRLVDGVVGPRRPGQRVAVPPGVPPDARLRDLCGDPVDRARARLRAAAEPVPRRLRLTARRPRHSRAAADLSRRAGGGPRRRAGLQHLAADRRRADPVGRAALVREPGVAQPVREHADGAVQPPHGGLRAVDRGDAARSSMSSARGAAARSSTARWRSACAVTLQAGIGIVTLLHQAPLPLALLHQVMGIVVLTIAVVHAERLVAAARAADAPFAAGASMPRGDDMIELTHRGGIAVMTMAHGKANALDIELCEAIAAQFEALRGSDAKAVVLTGQGRMFSAGVDLMRLERGRRGLCAALPAGAAPALRHGVLLSQARGGRGQRPRHRRRLRAAVLRRPAHRRARRRPHRRDRASGRRAVSAAGVRGDALCDAAARISPRRS